ncbi:MAG: hypothetical protein QM640_09750, partial [Niabella sp.]
MIRNKPPVACYALLFSFKEHIFVKTSIYMRIILFGTILLLFYTAPVIAQEDLVYQKPSAPILALADYEPVPSVSMDTKKNYMLLSYRSAYKSLEDLNQDELKLAGLRINPVTHISSTVTYVNNLKIRKIKDFHAEPVQVSGLPANARISNVSWSPDDTRIAFTNTVSNGVELWVIDVATAKASRLSEANLNAAMGTPFSWLKDNQTLLVKMVPANRAPL